MSDLRSELTAAIKEMETEYEMPFGPAAVQRYGDLRAVAAAWDEHLRPYTSCPHRHGRTASCILAAKHEVEAQRLIGREG